VGAGLNYTKCFVCKIYICEAKEYRVHCELRMALLAKTSPMYDPIRTDWLNGSMPGLHGTTGCVPPPSPPPFQDRYLMEVFLLTAGISYGIYTNCLNFPLHREERRCIEENGRGGGKPERGS
jgi:hypothetical protein